jgi:imidazolonepropionase
MMGNHDNMPRDRIICDRLWHNARLATLVGDGVGLLADGAVAARNGRIMYAGPAADVDFAPAESFDCGGRLITPGLIDCHTHLVHAGSRTNEFEARLAGASYEDIAAAGGGIASTVRATRAASEDELIAEALPRLDALIASGATTVEIKSGYGLSLAGELKMLCAARRLGELRDIRVVTSLLAAHALPPEFAGDKDGYITHVAAAILPAAADAGLVDAVDGFCETIAFSPAQIERIFIAAKAHGLPVKLHAEQLTNQGAAALAARFGALSADHLEHLDAAGVAAMAKAGTVAVLLPGAYFHLRETHPPPVALLRAAGVDIAIATDCNPGTSPLTSLLLTMHMAATQFRLTVPECLAGVTRNAARALGLAHEIGTLEAGKACDLAIWNAAGPADLVGRMGPNPLHARIRNGQ